MVCLCLLLPLYCVCLPICLVKCVCGHTVICHRFGFLSWSVVLLLLLPASVSFSVCLLDALHQCKTPDTSAELALDRNRRGAKRGAGGKDAAGGAKRPRVSFGGADGAAGRPQRGEGRGGQGAAKPDRGQGRGGRGGEGKSTDAKEQAGSDKKKKAFAKPRRPKAFTPNRKKHS